ncbi:MAG: hypothetical protein KKG25_13455 [Bacteroidetes bacterium]|nr:hypothetical protein [Bacteroidota bacterium]MBU2268134.1 hypothetical protein [Bacteroidota bacterium]MBU2377131.1 hypothetical protein [Bacteroidota bacterium]
MAQINPHACGCFKPSKRSLQKAVAPFPRFATYAKNNKPKLNNIMWHYKTT